MRRVLVTGSRDWRDVRKVRYELNRLWIEPVDMMLVHGACPRGADAIADIWANQHGCPVELHPARWQALGKRAGFARNAEMVALGADLCLAFIKDGSKGATHCADLAEKTGIKTFRFLSGEKS